MRQGGRRALIAVMAFAFATALLGSTSGASTSTANATTTNRQTGVAVGEGHFCALSSTGVVKCWGQNGGGQVGNGDPAGRFVTKPVTVLTGVARITVGDNHSCAVLKGSGQVECWGQNDAGEIGNGTQNDALKPTFVKGVGGTSVLRGVSTVVGGGDHTCAITLSGTVKCWGQNNEGVLGNGTTKNALSPVSVTGLQRVVSLALSAQVACAALKGGTVKCWGYTGDGELGVPGNGPQDCQFGEFDHPCATTPVTVKGVSGATAVAAGQNHVCALLKTAKVECWGNNSVTPVLESGLAGVKQLSLNGLEGDDKACALLTGGTVKCFAYDTAHTKPAPSTVAGFSPATFLFVGGENDCVVMVAGTVKCRGDNGTSTSKPVVVTGL